MSRGARTQHFSLPSLTAAEESLLRGDQTPDKETQLLQLVFPSACLWTPACVKLTVALVL